MFAITRRAARAPLVLVLVVSALAAACARADGSAEVNAGGRDPERRPAASEATAAGGIVDSALPIDELLRRFRAGIPSAPAELDGPRGRETLVRAFVEALADGDRARLVALGVDQADFAHLIFPSSPNARPPYRQDPAVTWLLTEQANAAALGRLLRRLGGQSVTYVAHACPDAPERQGENRIWRGCTVTVRAAGRQLTARLFGAVVERGGRFELLSFANEL